MKTVLVPLDFSDVSEHVLAAAVDLAESLKARMVLLHVVEPVVNYIPVGASMDVVAVPPPTIQQEDVEGPEKRLQALAESYRTRVSEIECLAIIGLSADEIVNHARSTGADYVVMGSHGHGALYHLFAGSVVTGVLKHTPCPVVVIPPSGKK